MEFIFEIFSQFLAELFLQAFVQVLVEFGFHSLAHTIRRPRSAVLSTVGFALWGGLAGGVSLWIFPTSPIHNLVFRQVNLFVTPAIVGLVMVLVGRIRLKKGQDIVRLDQFGYAFAFAFAMALVRYIWAA